MKLITISVVLYNTSLFDIEAVINSVDFTICDLVFFDNSNSASIKEYVERFAEVSYVSIGKNIGFGAAHNIVLKNTSLDTRYVLVLNPDVFFEKSLLKNLLSIYNVKKNVGIVAPKVVYPNGDLQYTCRLLPSIKDLLIRKFVIMTKGENSLELGDLRFTGYSKEMNVPFVLGCFLLLERSLYNAIGGFDERFFMYMEDLDLCRKVLCAEKDILFIPDVSITHRYGKGSRRYFKLMRYHFVSMMKYYNKWGWLFDEDRKRINNKVLLELGKLHQ